MGKRKNRNFVGLFISYGIPALVAIIAILFFKSMHSEISKDRYKTVYSLFGSCTKYDMSVSEYISSEGVISVVEYRALKKIRNKCGVNPINAFETLLRLEAKVKK